MKLIRKIAFLAFAFVVIMGSSNPLTAQNKYGHLNYGNLLDQIPDVKSGDTQLATFRDQLMKQGTDRMQKLQSDFQAYQQNAQAGTMTAVQMKEAEAKLMKEEQALKALEQEIIQKVAKKREELLKPILDKVDAAVKAVGKENGYAMIFDTSLFNFVLSADDTDDVMPLVKSKLGI